MAPEQQRLDRTQPIDLTQAEEIQDEPSRSQSKADTKAPTRKRIQTKVLEAAWFAEGDQFDEEEEAEEAETEVDAVPSARQQELERQARKLSSPEYRKYALELSPPAPPPVRMMEAFLGTTPDSILKQAARDPLPSTIPVPAPAPTPTPSSTIAPARATPRLSSVPTALQAGLSRPAPAPIPEAAANALRPTTEAPPPVMTPAAVALPPVAPSPVVTPAPVAPSPVAPPPVMTPAPVAPPLIAPPPIAPSQPAAVVTAPTLLGLGMALPLRTPAPLESKDPGVLPRWPQAGAPPPSPLVLPILQPPPSAPPLATTLSTPGPAANPPPSPQAVSDPAPVVPGLASVASSTALVIPGAQPSTARALVEKLTGNRVGTFILGLLAGGAIMLLCMAAFRPPALPSPAPAARPALVCPREPPVAKPHCPACPSPPPPVESGAGAPAPTTEADAAPAVSAQDGRQARALATAARRALKLRQWKKAHRLADESLRLDPGNVQAQRVRATAGTRLH